MNNLYYLSHGGPGSGRYPLGSGDRPYQKFEGRGKRRGLFSGYINAKREKKEREERQKAIQRQLRDAELKKRHDANKDVVLRKGTATEVLKYQGELTSKELMDAYNRIEWERKLSSISASERRATFNRIDSMMNRLGSINKWGSTGIDSWNLFVSIYNATPEGSRSPLPYVKKSGGGDGKK